MVMLPSPDGYGWKIVEGELVIDWTDEKPAPDSVIEMMSCKCKKPCDAKNDCACHGNGLFCTDMRKCVTCENIMDDEEEDFGEEEECDESDDEDDREIDVDE